MFEALGGPIAARDQRDLMERPFFSLAKAKRVTPIAYKTGDTEVQVYAVPEHGMATIWDADVLIWAGSQIVEALDRGLPTSRFFRFTPYQLLTAIGRATGNREYQLLRGALTRLFAAASAREAAIVPEVSEEPITLKPMTAGREVVEDYGHVGLTLREHPVSFLRRDLAGQKVLTCADAGATRDGRAVKVAGLVLVRQKPGSAKGVMFITIEDETGVANLVIWPSLYEKQRRVILTAGMLRVDGRVQREGEVVHVVAHRLHDLSDALASVGDREGSFPLPHGRGDEFHHGSPGHDPRDQPPRGVKPRDIYIPDLSLEAIRVRTRDFR